MSVIFNLLILQKHFLYETDFRSRDMFNPYDWMVSGCLGKPRHGKK